MEGSMGTKMVSNLKRQHNTRFQGRSWFHNHPLTYNGMPKFTAIFYGDIVPYIASLYVYIWPDFASYSDNGI